MRLDFSTNSSKDTDIFSFLHSLHPEDSELNALLIVVLNLPCLEHKKLDSSVIFNEELSIIFTFVFLRFIFTSSAYILYLFSSEHLGQSEPER